MKLYRYLTECEAAGNASAATPGNTIGMGNPMNPTETEPGSEPLPTGKSKKQKFKMKKSLKDYILKESTLEAIEGISKMNDKDFDFVVESLYACTGASELKFQKYKNDFEEALRSFSDDCGDDIMYYEGDNTNGVPSVLTVTDFDGVEYQWDFKKHVWKKL